MQALQLKPRDKFTINHDNKIRVFIREEEAFMICHYLPYDGYTVYVPKESEVELVVEDEEFVSNPDHRKNML